MSFAPGAGTEKKKTQDPEIGELGARFAYGRRDI